MQFATNTRTIAVCSIAVAFLVMGIKYLAFVVTGSVALYSDALESVVNVAAALVALIAVSISARPPDHNHQFGHQKAELISAVFEGALIIVAALIIINEAYDALVTPRVIDEPVLGLMINGGATIINGGWAVFLINRGKALHSPALNADGRHLITDVWTSIGVFVGISVAVTTGWSVLDPIIAVAVALNILWSGYGIVYNSLSMLMDEAAPKEIQDRVSAAIRAHGGGALQAHDIRTRHSGRIVFIEFHLVVPGTMTVAAAHEICDRIELALEAEIEDADVVIHVEPEHEAKKKSVEAIDLHDV